MYLINQLSKGFFFIESYIFGIPTGNFIQVKRNYQTQQLKIIHMFNFKFSLFIISSLFHMNMMKQLTNDTIISYLKLSYDNPVENNSC